MWGPFQRSSKSTLTPLSTTITPAPASATAGEVAAPVVFAESQIHLLLPSQSDQQPERLFHSLLLGRVSGHFLGFRHQRVVDLDIRAHWRHSVVACVDEYAVHIPVPQCLHGRIWRASRFVVVHDCGIVTPVSL